MPVDAHEISFGYKYSLLNWEVIGNVAISTCSPAKKFKYTMIFRTLSIFFEAQNAPVKMYLKKKKVILLLSSLFQRAMH